MDRSRLEQLANDFSRATPEEYTELANLCRDIAINELDVRFMLLKECFEISYGFWGEGGRGAASPDFVSILRNLWESYLPAIIDSDSEETATALAAALEESLTALASVDPLTFRRDGDS